MSKVSISSQGDIDFGGLLSHLLDVPDAIGKAIFPNSRSRNGESEGNIPVDILETPKQLIIYMDVPGLSKSDVQVTVEEEKLLVVRSNGKRKRGENEEEEEGCKYLRLERRPPRNLICCRAPPPQIVIGFECYRIRLKNTAKKPRRRRLQLAGDVGEDDGPKCKQFVDQG